MLVQVVPAGTLSPIFLYTNTGVSAGFQGCLSSGMDLTEEAFLPQPVKKKPQGELGVLGGFCLNVDS